MKFLPYHAYTKEALLSSTKSTTKGKRKADVTDVELAGESLAKKAAAVRQDEGDMETEV